MEWQVTFTDELRQARKSYPCDASQHWLDCGVPDDECSPDQLLVLQAARADGWKILRGQTYRYARGIFEGHMATYRARPGMESLCHDHGLYD